MASESEREEITVAGRTLTYSSPNKVYFPDAKLTKRDVIAYVVAVAEGALRGAGGRPNVLVRYPHGIDGEHFWQKRAPSSRPSWIEVATLTFPSGRTAEEVVPRDAAALVWMAGLGCLELHPHPVRAEDLEHPDELRIDLDPMPGVSFAQVQDVARVVRETLGDLGLVGWPKTSGSRGIHVLVRLEPRWSFAEVRRAALAFAREVERRAPSIATSKWWKEERHGVFLDYNQNAKDRTVCSAYSIRPRPDARVSMPLAWEELLVCEPADFTIRTVPAIVRDRGDAHAHIDARAFRLDALLELSRRQEAEGLGDASWPPHYQKQEGEPSRVQPSRAKKKAAPTEGAADATDTKRSGRRVSSKPLVEIGRADKKDEALAGLERWKARHPEVAPHLWPEDVLVDAMRGRYRTWTRVRVNLEHVPTELRPPQEALDPAYDPWDPRPVNAGGASRRRARVKSEAEAVSPATPVGDGEEP
ncbi:MAG: DNA polymerase domain-containing protein [Sandaracinaceae bacterium]|nr:DNA polymerase domain-containing protein [Sandaracinaceae bacterium]